MTPTATIELPACVTAHRIGEYAESEYDVFGELAPVTWVCLCGRRLTLEYYRVHYRDDDEEYGDIIDEGYVAVPAARRREFLAEHASCLCPHPDDDLFEYEGDRCDFYCARCGEEF